MASVEAKVRTSLFNSFASWSPMQLMTKLTVNQLPTGCCPRWLLQELTSAVWSIPVRTTLNNAAVPLARTRTWLNPAI